MATAKVVERTPDRWHFEQRTLRRFSVLASHFGAIRRRSPGLWGPLLVCIAVLNKRYPYSLRSNSSCCSAVCGFEHARRSRRCHCLFDWREREWWLVFGRFVGVLLGFRRFLYKAFYKAFYKALYTILFQIFIRLL